MRGGANSKAALAALFTVTLALLGCLLLYRFDNKYTVSGPQARDGVLVLEAAALEEHPVLFLVEGWEYYGGRLLSPEDFSRGAPAPDAYIYIGQYGGFEAGSPAGSPHGSASYRLRISLPARPGSYTLELPEIFSAYRLYLNGEAVAAMGEPDPRQYRPQTGNQTLHIQAGGQIELLFAVSDFSHLYSGMVYPPAFGQPQAVARLLNTRLILRGLLVAFALAVGLLAVLTGLLGGNTRLALLYGLLCICFVGFSSYPLLRTLLAGPPALYGLELVSFCAMLMVVMLLQGQILGGGGRWSRCFIGFGAVMCLFSALQPLLLPAGALWGMAAYSFAVSAYELLTAAFITVTATLALRRGKPHSAVLLCGFLIMDAALVMDRLLPLYEPIVGGWFYELASFALVLCLGGAVGQELAAKYRESVALTERQRGMERLAQMQKASYALLMEKVEETKAVRHDLRHHFRMIDGFLQSRAFDKLGEYVAQYRASIAQEQPISYTPNIVADILLRHYAQIARGQEIAFTAQARLNRDCAIDDSDLCAVLSNLLENAVEACARAPKQTFISLVLTQEKAALSIHMENSAVQGAARQSQGFLSSKAEGRIGYGITSVIAVARRYGGEAQFAFDEARGVFRSTVLLLVP